MNASTNLDALRREIDGIDREIHDRLMRRAEVVEKIGHLKDGFALRPGREASLLRALLARHSGALPKATVARLWREVMAAMTRLQTPLAIAVCAPEKSVGYWDLARDHFGSSTPMTLHRTAHAVLRAVAQDPGTVGILPPPADDDEAPWWPQLAATPGPDAARIVARLPFVPNPVGRYEDLSAVAVARAEPEASGDDRTLIALGSDEQVSRARVGRWLEAAMLDAYCVAAARSAGGWSQLIDVAGFVPRSDPRLDALRKAGGKAIGSLVVVGAYARPGAA